MWMTSRKRHVYALWKRKTFGLETCWHCFNGWIPWKDLHLSWDWSTKHQPISHKSPFNSSPIVAISRRLIHLSLREATMFRNFRDNKSIIPRFWELHNSNCLCSDKTRLWLVSPALSVNYAAHSMQSVILSHRLIGSGSAWLVGRPERPRVVNTQQARRRRLCQCSLALPATLTAAAITRVIKRYHIMTAGHGFSFNLFYHVT